MEPIPQYQIRQPAPHIDISTLRSKIAIDKSPIAPFKKLELGEKLSMTYTSIEKTPPPLKPFSRSIKSRSEATFSTLPLIITQLAQSGPDADFTMSMEALSTISSAICFDSPLALVFYNINDHFFFDEPLRHESHPWSQLFIHNNLVIDTSDVENISMLSTIASSAFDKTKNPQWFSNLKSDVIASERSQQRWFRDTEKYLPLISEDFSRSFLCGIPDVSLHIGSNSVICDINEKEPAIIRYCKGDPTEKQMCQWILEALLTACKNILITSSESMELTRFEVKQIPTLNSQRLGSIFNFLRYIKKYSTEFGCYMLHKRANSNTLILRKASDSELEATNLTKSYEMRISLLEMMIGFRQTLSTNANIIENGRKLLYKTLNYSSPLNKSLSLERIGDSLILPILLLDRTKSLISTTTFKTAEKVTFSSYDEAINCYNLALETENLPESLITSLHHKIATSKFAKAVLTHDDEIGKESLKCDEITQNFKYNVFVWRCQNALELLKIGNNASSNKPKSNPSSPKTKNQRVSPSSSSTLSSSSSSLTSSSAATNVTENDSEYYSQMAQSLAFSALRLAENDEEKIEPKRLLAKALNAEAQSNLDVQRFTRASERFQRAHALFESIDDKEHLAETESNLAHIERRLADVASITHKGKFTQEEERRLMSAAKYYLTAIDRVKDVNQEISDNLSLNLASLYRSIVVRYTQMPPTNRMKPENIIEEVNRCINEATNILKEAMNRQDSLSDTNSNQIQIQFAALNTWQARFITDFELKHIPSVLIVKHSLSAKSESNSSKSESNSSKSESNSTKSESNSSKSESNSSKSESNSTKSESNSSKSESNSSKSESTHVKSESTNNNSSVSAPFVPSQDDIEKEKQALISTARNLFTKARQFLIADLYPADFVSITISLASLKLLCGQYIDAMRIMMDCLKALLPTSIIVRPKNLGNQFNQSLAQQQQSQSLSISRSVLNNMLPKVLDMIKDILRELLLDKHKRKQPCDFEKRLYKSSLETHEDGVVNLMLEIKKALKL